MYFVGVVVSMEETQPYTQPLQWVQMGQKNFFSSQSSSVTFKIEDRVWLRGWFPLMFELSAVIRFVMFSAEIQL